MTCQFAIGEKVKAIALPDAFPSVRPAVPNLTVESIRLIESESIPSYFRVLARASDGFGYVEGSERFFEHES